MSDFKWTERSQAFEDYWGEMAPELKCSKGDAAMIFIAGMQAATHFEDLIKEEMRDEIRAVLRRSESVLYGPTYAARGRGAR